MPEWPNPPATHNTPFRAGKGYLYEGGLRVPLIVRGPGLARQHVDTPVVSTDWLPTLLDSPAVSQRAGSTASAWRGCCAREAAGRAALYWHLPHYTNQGGRPGGRHPRRRLEARRALRGRRP